MPTAMPKRECHAPLSLLLLLSLRECLAFFPAPFLVWPKFPLKFSFQEADPTLWAGRGPPLVSQGTQHSVLAESSSNCSSVGFSSSPSLGAVWSPLYNQLPARTLKTSQLKKTECPLDASLRIKLPSHPGGAPGRMDLRMRPRLLLACPTDLLEAQARRRIREGQGVTPQSPSETHFLSIKLRL